MLSLMVKTFFDQPIKSELKTYENVRKIPTGKGDDYTNGCFLDHCYFIQKLQNNCDKFK